MILRLLLRGPGRLLSAIPEKTLESGHLVIGRSNEADWMIPDPDKVISKAHCRIDRTERGFMLTDTSTNGIRINDIPVGRGLPSLLSNGDVLTLGDAIIGVEILALAPRAALPMAAVETAPIVAAPATIIAPAETPTDTRSLTPFPDGPFGFDDAAAPATAPVVTDTLAEPPQAVAIQPLLTDWWDPNAASGKPGLPLSADGVSGGAVIAPPFPAPEQVASTLHNDEEQTLSRAAGSVDVNTLLQAVETAAQVLTKDEREKFERRLRDILQAGAMHRH
jgi:type VI secretion system FHA domain protein